MTDDIDPELITEINEAMAHGLAAEVLDGCRSKPPHLHLANMSEEVLEGAPRVHEVGVIVTGTVPVLSDEDRAEAAAQFEPPCDALINEGLHYARHWKEEAVNDNNGPCDISPVMRVSWPTFAAVFDLGEYCEALNLHHPSAAMKLVREAMCRPYGIPIGVELIIDSWMYHPPEGTEFVERIRPAEALRRGLPGAYESMHVSIATPTGAIQRWAPYRYGGGNVEWIDVAKAGMLKGQDWVPWGGQDSDGTTSEGNLVSALKSMFDGPRVRARTTRRKEKPDGPAQ